MTRILALQRAAGNHAVAVALQGRSSARARRVDRNLHGGQVGGAVVGPGGAQYTIRQITPSDMGTLYELTPAAGEPFSVYGNVGEFSLAPGTQRSPLSEWARLDVAGREAAGGLAAQAPVGHFAANAVNFARDNPDKSFEDLVTFLFGRVSLLLKMIGSVPPELEFRDSGAMGVFTRNSWKLFVNRNGDNGKLTGKKMRDLTRAELADAADTVYHEARHSEQFFRIARVHAGNNESAVEIEAKTNISPAVVAAAVQKPLQRGPQTDALVGEAEAWSDITVGRHVEYMQGVKDLQEPADKLLRAAEGLLGPQRAVHRFDFFQAFDQLDLGIQKVKRAALDRSTPDVVKTPALRIAMQHRELMTEVTEAKGSFSMDNDRATKLADLAAKLHSRRMDAYKAFAHEADAYRVGGAVAAAVTSAR